MARRVENWIDSYVQLMENTEPAKVFDIWTGYSLISSALRRKVSLQLGRLTYYSNIYVVFVAEPGVARKTRAIDFGMPFLENIPDLKLSSDSATKEAMTDDIEAALDRAILESGEEFGHSSLIIVSREFESFLGQKKENTRMLTALTDLFDCPKEWSSRTRHGKSAKIVKPWITLLAATTPESLANSLPASAVGGGLTSRILFIWADKKKKSVAIPSMTEAEVKIKKYLEEDLYQISRISGEYSMTSGCMKNWVDWYNAYDEDESGERICTDKSFSGWYSRKPTYIIKVALLCAAAESNKLVVEWKHIERAIKEIINVEHLMGNAFKAIGRSEVSGDVDAVLNIIKVSKLISERTLMSKIWRDIDSTKFDNVISTCIKTGKVRREFKPGNDLGVIWYKWVE